jgi:hypothetical protein
MRLPIVRPLAIVSLGALAALAGCVVTAPPPPRVYAAPPPPPPPPPPPAASYSEPAIDAEVQASEPPPPLPEYEQPPCPEEGWLWTPGYWAWNGGYYWVPGTWVAPPRVGVLWTPGYWGFVGGVYLFHAGYWGPHIGFYGGVNYGFGYGGVGFVGGEWRGGVFAYNTAVVRVNTTVIHNTYVNNTVINNTTVNNTTVNRVSYNGPGGVAAQPTPAERTAMHEQHVPPTPMQRQHFTEAVKNPALSAKANGGHPTIAATARPAVFNGPSVVPAHGAPAHLMPAATHGAPGAGPAPAAGHGNAPNQAGVNRNAPAGHPPGVANTQHAQPMAQPHPAAPRAPAPKPAPKPAAKPAPEKRHEGERN